VRPRPLHVDDKLRVFWSFDDRALQEYDGGAFAAWLASQEADAAALAAAVASANGPAAAAAAHAAAQQQPTSTLVVVGQKFKPVPHEPALVEAAAVAARQKASAEARVVGDAGRKSDKQQQQQQQERKEKKQKAPAAAAAAAADAILDASGVPVPAVREIEPAADAAERLLSGSGSRGAAPSSAAAADDDAALFFRPLSSPSPRLGATALGRGINLGGEDAYVRYVPSTMGDDGGCCYGRYEFLFFQSFPHFFRGRFLPLSLFALTFLLLFLFLFP
jgi:hypothetical protein